MRILRMSSSTRFQRVPWLEAKGTNHRLEGDATICYAALITGMPAAFSISANFITSAR